MQYNSASHFGINQICTLALKSTLKVTLKNINAAKFPPYYWEITNNVYVSFKLHIICTTFEGIYINTSSHQDIIWDCFPWIGLQLAIPPVMSENHLHKKSTNNVKTVPIGIISQLTPCMMSPTHSGHTQRSELIFLYELW